MKLRSINLGTALVCFSTVIFSSVFAADLKTNEMNEARAWTQAKFEGVSSHRSSKPGLVIIANHDAVQFNTRDYWPLKIGETQYRHGLYCHAISKIRVQLPAPAKSFSAVVGLDNNSDTNNGCGSVVFSVSANSKELFRSGVMRVETPAAPVNVDLAGASEFTLEVGDAGDGTDCDQADWAEAKVTLKDGRALWLGDMPLIDETQSQTYDLNPPFSFIYDGQSSADLLKNWGLKRASRKLDNQRTERTLTYTDPKTGLVARCIGIEYNDFPTIEWTLYLKNTGASDTPIIENIQAIDTHFEGDSHGEFVLHHQTGSPARPDDYEPFDTPLAPKSDFHIATSGGRGSNSSFPYFNIEWPSEGVIVVVGWPGQWAAQFTRDEGRGLRARAGQELTHFKLHPNEEARTPLIVLQFWKGERIQSQNVWRRWMLAHNLPRPGGKLPTPQMTPCSSHQFQEMALANEQNQKQFIDRYVEEGLKPDYWWMDTGWFPFKGSWVNTGTWEVDMKRFPHGLRAISDHAHEKNVKIIVWFEPERVTADTWLYDKHPEWLLTPPPNPGGQAYENAWRVLDLGNPEARQWLTDHVDKLLTEQGIDLYRQDFNIDPLLFWRNNDTSDRQGITEIKYIEGYLAYWDELRRRHPNMLIDSCASGGRRNDLETLRRAVPLLRSDYIFEPIGQQSHTYGISLWLPFYGTGTFWIDKYSYRSTMAPAMTPCWDVRRTDLDYPLLRTMVNEWRQVSPYYLGDYYPLTAYSLKTTEWIGWQFNKPEIGEGMVQAFRRPDSTFESARFKLSGLEPDTQYKITDFDTKGSITISGRELMEKGLLVKLDKQPDAAIITYKRMGGLQR